MTLLKAQNFFTLVLCIFIFSSCSQDDCLISNENIISDTTTISLETNTASIYNNEESSINNIPTQKPIEITKEEKSYYESLFLKAQTLYHLADGITGEEYIYTNNNFYLDGDINQITLDCRINDFLEIFSKDMCINILDGNREKNGSEYIVASYGLTTNGKTKIITSEKLLNNNLSEFSSISLFSPIRGKNLSYAAGYLDIMEIGSENVVLRYTALYLGNNNENIEYSIKAENNQWIITNSSLSELIGHTYILNTNDYIIEYSYNLILEDGKWKFNNFELWY